MENVFNCFKLAWDSMERVTGGSLPRRSFCGNHFITLTFSGIWSGTGPEYLHSTWTEGSQIDLVITLSQSHFDFFRTIIQSVQISKMCCVVVCNIIMAETQRACHYEIKQLYFSNVKSGVHNNYSTNFTPQNTGPKQNKTEYVSWE